MATTENTYTGDGSTILYNFTFPYIDESDVYVSLDGTVTTAYIYANATTIQFNTAPATGVAIKIFRSTNSADTKAAFFAGSAIRSKDLNDNFTQSLYIAQESENVADAAKAQAAAAEASAATANTNATAAAASAATATAQATASAASAATAQAQATQASTDAAAAQASATSAQTSATAAQTSATAAAADAATAATDAQTAVTTANSATTTANTADTNATTALSRVNTYLHDGTNPVGDGVGSNPQGLLYAINTANTATTTANSATATANTADTNASAAVTTANAASATATAASNAVAAAAFYSPYAALANLPSSPSDGDRAEVANSTGVESSTAVDGVPSGFVGATDLTVRLQYNGTSGKWDWQNYFASDPDNRYLTESQPVVKGDATNGSGEITLNCENNTHGVTIKGPAHSAAATYTITLPDDAGSNGHVLKTDGSGNTSWAAADVVADTSPQLGGELDCNNNNIINTNIILGSNPHVRGAGVNGTASLSNYGSSSNSIDSNLTLSPTRLDLYFSGIQHLTFDSNSDLTVTNSVGGQRGFAIYGGSTNNYLRFKPPTSFTTTTYTLPAADGSSGQALVTDGSGVLSFADAGAPTLDGGNFDSGGSLVTTSNTIDGGSF